METIVVGVDGSEHAAAALRWAIDEARAHKSTLRVVHVWQPPTIEGYPYTRGGFDDRANERAAHEVLNRAVHCAVGDEDDPKLETVVICGSPAPALVRQSEDADLVVLGSRGRGGFTGLLLGSVSQEVAHHAKCPVVIVR